MHDVVIVGSGFAGIGLGIRLKQERLHDFVILERADRVGGTWRDNHYPGVACDVESHLYSYSFAPNPTWTRQFAPQSEILAYLETCVERFGLAPHIRYGAEVKSCRFDDDDGVWHVALASGETITARVVVGASGLALSRPTLPDVPGRDTFAGKAMHSARWDDGYDLTGKRVAIIGTGASAIQIVPAIAKRVGKLHVFQRTAPWIVPKPDGDISARARARFARWPSLQMLARRSIYWKRELLGAGFVLDPRINRVLGRVAGLYRRAQVKDRALLAKVTPDYTMGCKRVLPSNDWYRTLQRPNVELVTDGIAEIRAHTIVTKDGAEREVDVIVYATGFEAAEVRPQFAIRGRDGKDILDAWKDGFEAYLGTTVSGFPNAFLVVGPNTGLGHNSMILMMESQFAYILDAIKTIKSKKLRFVEVKPEAQRTYNEEIQARLAKRVWAVGGCKSWYTTKDGKNTTLWPGFTFEYRLRTRRFDAENYELSPIRSAARPEAAAPVRGRDRDSRRADTKASEPTCRSTA
ncbi:MAG TPA: NAD(P)/FAD-dependent oxidoreductase [Labilithrix sp.]|jgi:cation diffusion facilitator CzcD-associated flavoprotein CzcO